MQLSPTILLANSNGIGGRGPIAGSLGILVGIGLVDVGRVHSTVSSILLCVCDDGARVVVTLLLQLAACKRWHPPYQTTSRKS